MDNHFNKAYIDRIDKRLDKAYIGGRWISNKDTKLNLQWAYIIYVETHRV